ncbi:NTF2-like protein [Abortiporus biennis]|nr:NTF2-like protein [Abortiporus biennis]
MHAVYPNAVKSVDDPPLLLVLAAPTEGGWCQQLSEEGYNALHVAYPPVDPTTLQEDLESCGAKIGSAKSGWGLVTYGFNPRDAPGLLTSNIALESLKVCVHYTPQSEIGEDLLAKYQNNQYVPTVIHLSASQATLEQSLNTLAEPTKLEYKLLTNEFPPISVFRYEKVGDAPPFPYLSKAPALVVAGETFTTDPYVRSATNLSYTRSLEVLKRYMGPHYPFEKLWEKHTYYEFVERDAPKTMSTMVSTPYVNHISTMTGGVGFQDLARFYKYHFTKDNVTPPDTELITVSRTVGADRIIDEMIFKCTHTTEIDYFLPGIKPTGKPLEIALVGVVVFRGDKLTFEHIYWDQASVLVQLGLLETNKGLPIAGVEAARKVLDPFGMPSNTLMDKWKESEGLSID